MSNKRKGIAYGKASPDLVKQVRGTVTEGTRRRYSVSKVYAAYNAVFELKETPQTCSSCLVNRVGLLAAWLKGYDEYQAKAQKITPGVFAALPDVVELTNAATDEVTAYQMKDGVFADINGNTAPSGIYDGPDGKRYDVDEDGRYTEAVTSPDPNDPQYPAPAQGIVRIPMAEGAPIDLTPDEDVALDDPNAKGKVRYADGTAVKPGTYATAAGGELSVQVGGRGTLKPKEEDLT